MTEHDTQNQDQQIVAGAIPVVSNGSGDWAVSLACPVCGDVMIHPLAVITNPAGKLLGQLGIAADGLHLDRSIRPDGRGVKIALAFFGECGHRFLYEFHFHKGGTFFRCRAGDATGSEQTLWRD